MNAEKLRTARAQGLRPQAPNADLRGADLRGADLLGADLRGADLRDADLLGADLRGADLRDADLLGADLRGANLSGADLSGADLWKADLSGANLSGANLWGANGILQITGMPSGQLILIPTCGGWQLRVGCWTGTLDELRSLISQDGGWPEAKGEEITRRRPILEAALTLCEAHMALHPGLIESLAEKWGTK